MTAPREESVPALPLSRRRRLLGYMIPLLNLPLFTLKIYQTWVHLSSGVPVNSLEFFNDIVLLGLTFSLGFILPWWAPIYESRYGLTHEGVTIKRPLRGSTVIPYRSIVRAEIYIKKKPTSVVSKDALRYAKGTVEALKRSGFKFSDYTNAEETIVLLLTENRVYMMSPEKPKSFIKRLRRHIPKLYVRLVELTSKGKRVRDF